MDSEPCRKKGLHWVKQLFYSFPYVRPQTGLPVGMVDPMFSGIFSERKVVVKVVSIMDTIVQPKQNTKARFCEDRVCRLEKNVKTRDVRF